MKSPLACCLCVLVAFAPLAHGEDAPPATQPEKAEKPSARKVYRGVADALRRMPRDVRPGMDEDLLSAHERINEWLEQHVVGARVRYTFEVRDAARTKDGYTLNLHEPKFEDKGSYDAVADGGVDVRVSTSAIATEDLPVRQVARARERGSKRINLAGVVTKFEFSVINTTATRPILGLDVEISIASAR